MVTPWREGMREAVTRLAGQKGEDSASGPRTAKLNLSHSFVARARVKTDSRAPPSPKPKTGFSVRSSPLNYPLSRPHASSSPSVCVLSFIPLSWLSFLREEKRCSDSGTLCSRLNGDGSRKMRHYRLQKGTTLQTVR